STVLSGTDVAIKSSALWSALEIIGLSNNRPPRSSGRDFRVPRAYIVVQLIRQDAIGIPTLVRRFDCLRNAGVAPLRARSSPPSSPHCFWSFRRQHKPQALTLVALPLLT